MRDRIATSSNIMAEASHQHFQERLVYSCELQIFSVYLTFLYTAIATVTFANCPKFSYIASQLASYKSICPHSILNSEEEMMILFQRDMQSICRGSYSQSFPIVMLCLACKNFTIQPADFAHIAISTQLALIGKGVYEQFCDLITTCKVRRLFIQLDRRFELCNNEEQLHTYSNSEDYYSTHTVTQYSQLVSCYVCHKDYRKACSRTSNMHTYKWLLHSNKYKMIKCIYTHDIIYLQLTIVVAINDIKYMGIWKNDIDAILLLIQIIHSQMMQIEVRVIVVIRRVAVGEI